MSPTNLNIQRVADTFGLLTLPFYLYVSTHMIVNMIL